jgi:hypothetical protein
MYTLPNASKEEEVIRRLDPERTVLLPLAWTPFLLFFVRSVSLDARMKPLQGFQTRGVPASFTSSARAAKKPRFAPTKPPFVLSPTVGGHRQHHDHSSAVTVKHMQEEEWVGDRHPLLFLSATPLCEHSFLFFFFGITPKSEK